MERIPILKMGEFLLVTIQVDMHDQLAMVLQDDLTDKISRTSARGVLIDISAVEVVDSFIGRMIANIAAMARILDAQTVLVRVGDGTLAPRPGRESWSPEGLLAFSKVCTHAGCPVGLYQADTHQLLCPCHQSAFDVLDRARPTFGPATRALPQLPLVVDDEGYVRAQSDFHEPVGPAYWDRD